VSLFNIKLIARIADKYFGLVSLILEITLPRTIQVGAITHSCNTSTTSPITGDRFQTIAGTLFYPAAGFSGTTVQSTGANSGSMHNVDCGYAKGQTIAVFDGLGGHPDPAEKKQIGEVSRAAAEGMVKKVNGLQEVADWGHELSQCFQAVGAYVSKWFQATYPKHPLKHACGTVVRINKDSQKNKFIAHAASIGDCMAFAWNPTTQKFTQISSARQLGIYSCVNPQSITDFAKRNFKVFYNKCQLGKNDIVFCVSDGVHDLLPHTIAREDIGDDQYYLRTDLNATAMKEILSTFDTYVAKEKRRKAKLGDYSSFFREYIILKSEERRQAIFGENNIVTDIVSHIKKYLQVNFAVDTSASFEHSHTYAAFVSWLEINANATTIANLQMCLDFLGIGNEAIDADFTVNYLLELLMPYQKNNVAAGAEVEIGDDATLIAYRCR
jgi:hypothetical protein